MILRRRRQHAPENVIFLGESGCGMARDGFFLSFINQLDDESLNIKVLLEDPESKTPPPPARINEEGAFEFVLWPPDEDERHIALGKFMDRWSGLEQQMRCLLGGILNTEPAHMPVIMNSLGTRGQLDVLMALGSRIFDDNSFVELSAILSRIKEANTRRNYIVHGHWLTEVLMRWHGKTPAVVYKVYRAYLPSDPDKEMLARDIKNKKDREKYYFSVRRIHAIAQSIFQCTGHLANFTLRHFP